MDGITALQQRIATIESRFGVARPQLAAPIAPTGAPGVGSAPSGTFDAALTAALGVQGGSLRPAARLAPGQYGRLEPPAELARYGNGQVPAEALTSIGVGGHRLWGPAAEAFTALLADARRDGVSIGVTDSYRDLAGQRRLAASKGLYSQGGLAATPGTSNHGWGLAVDLDLDDRAQAWMRENGWRYGFVEDVPREPWHWTYRPAT